jgi:hypothetical protein
VPDAPRNGPDGYVSIEPEYINAPEDRLTLLKEKEQRLEALAYGNYDDEDADEEALAEEHDRLEQEIQQLCEELLPYLGFHSEVKATAMLQLSIDRNGDLQQKAYRQIPKSPNTPFDASDSGMGESALTMGQQTEPSEAPASQELSQSLIHDLGIYRTQMVQAAIGRDFDASFDMMTFSLCERLLVSEIEENRYASHRSPIDVTLTRYADKTAQDDAAFTVSGQMRQEQFQALSLTWMQSGSEAERFHAFCALPLAEKQKLFSYCTSVGISSGMYYGKSHPALDVMAERLGVVPHECWRPSETNFFKRLKKPQLLLLIDELLGESWVAKVADQTKGQMVTWLGRVFEGNPSATSGMDAAILERISHWMPKGMTFTASNHGATGEHRPSAAPETSASSEQDDALPDWLMEEEAA